MLNHRIHKVGLDTDSELGKFKASSDKIHRILMIVNAKPY
jgi:hypothetical protein